MEDALRKESPYNLVIAFTTIWTPLRPGSDDVRFYHFKWDNSGLTVEANLKGGEATMNRVGVSQSSSGSCG